MHSTCFDSKTKIDFVRTAQDKRQQQFHTHLSEYF